MPTTLHPEIFSHDRIIAEPLTLPMQIPLKGGALFCGSARFIVTAPYRLLAPGVVLVYRPANDALQILRAFSLS